MSLRTEIEANYTDAYGLVNPSPCLKTDFDKTGNGLLYTSLYYLQLKKTNEFTLQDLTTFVGIIDRCEVRLEDDKGSRADGLLNRSPTKKDQNGADDYYGVSCLDGKDAEWILRHGKCSFWIFNNETPGKFTWKAWFGRMPWFVAHVHFCAGIKPNIFLRAALCARLALGSLGTSPSGRTLDWLMVISCMDSWICRQATKLWWWGLHERFSWGMKQVMQEYFGPNHPLATYWID